ncbi:MAG: hypothetical protein V4510_09145 [bacterium]
MSWTATASGTDTSSTDWKVTTTIDWTSSTSSGRDVRQETFAAPAGGSTTAHPVSPYCGPWTGCQAVSQIQYFDTVTQSWQPGLAVTHATAIPAFCFPPGLGPLCDPDQQAGNADSTNLGPGLNGNAEFEIALVFNNPCWKKGTPAALASFDTGSASPVVELDSQPSADCKYDPSRDIYWYDFTISAHTQNVTYRGGSFGFLERSSITFHVPHRTYGPIRYNDWFDNSGGAGSIKCDAGLASDVSSGMTDYNTWAAAQEQDSATRTLPVDGDLSLLRDGTNHWIVDLPGTGTGMIHIQTARQGPVVGPYAWSFDDVVWTAHSQPPFDAVVLAQGSSVLFSPV